MALNWFLTLRNLAKTDANAAALLEQLKTAETDDEKETAKANAQAYLQEIQTSNSGSENTVISETNPVVAEETGTDSGELRAETSDEGNTQTGTDSGELRAETSDEGNTQTGIASENNSTQEESKEKSLMLDLSQPAFTPRLAKYGITREEELFLNGVFVRKMDRNEKILMRRSIYQKKTQVAAKIQAEYKAKRIAQKEKDARDPEKIRFHQERKYISAIVNALEEHKNLGWVFSNIEGLTLDVFRDLMKKPGNVNAINAANPNFLANFRKKYGE